MDYCEYPPAPALRPFVACYWTLAGAGGQPERVLPDGRAELVVHLGDSFENQARALFIGQQRQAVLLRPLGRVDVFGVRFRPAGASAFFRIPQSELASRIVPLAGVGATAWESEMYDAPSTALRCQRTDAFLLRRPSPSPPSARILAAIQAPPGTPIELLAARAGVSRRQLEREFLHAVGLPPKTWTRIVRFQHALALRRAGRPWASVALSAGYYDQAHLIGDCRRITGLAPLARETGETAMERMLVANFQDTPPAPPLGSTA